jgi:hypothetical protein
MARLHVITQEHERLVEVVLSRRNLLTPLHMLDTPGSVRQIENNDRWEDAAPTPWYPGEDEGGMLPRPTLVLRCEDGGKHYGKREVGPGSTHPASEAFAQSLGAAAGEVPLLSRTIRASSTGVSRGGPVRTTVLFALGLDRARACTTAIQSLCSKSSGWSSR